MPAKIKKRLKALKFSELAKPRFFDKVSRFIKDEIVNTIQKGISPVNQKKTSKPNTSGRSRFGEYSDSYKRSFGSSRAPNKKKRPVNLTLTGKMLNSIKVRKTREYVKVWFADEKAKYHNDEGAGRSKIIRRLLPKDGEQFSRNIQNKIVEALGEAIAKVLK